MSPSIQRKIELLKIKFNNLLTLLLLQSKIQAFSVSKRRRQFCKSNSVHCRRQYSDIEIWDQYCKGFLLMTCKLILWQIPVWFGVLFISLHQCYQIVDLSLIPWLLKSVVPIVLAQIIQIFEKRSKSIHFLVKPSCNFGTNFSSDFGPLFLKPTGHPASGLHYIGK